MRFSWTSNRRGGSWRILHTLEGSLLSEYNGEVSTPTEQLFAMFLDSVLGVSSVALRHRDPWGPIQPIEFVTERVYPQRLAR